MWAWVYRDGLITSAWPKEGFDRLAPAMDPICYATKGKVLLNLKREGDPWKAWHEKKPTDNGLSNRHRIMDGVTAADGHWPRTVIAEPDIGKFQYFSLPRTSGAYRAERVGHPNQKPLTLMQWLVQKLPLAGTVIDPFMGSGSTAIACMREGFRFIGIEQSEEYFNIAVKRLQAEYAKQPLFAEAP
jgi:hypothetical protein